MDGACEDVEHRFESAPDMEALGVERAEDEVPPAVPTPVMLKAAGGDDWSLLAEPAY